MSEAHTTSRRRVLAAGAGVLATGGLGGCLGGGGSDSGLPREVEVTMTSQPTPMFEPRMTQVAVDGTVRWTMGTGDHDTTAYHPDTYGPARIPPDAEPWASGTMTMVGERYERTFDVPGVYDYVDTQAVCTAHEQIGNVGRVVVGWPEWDPSAQPALRPPQPELPRIARSRLETFNERTRPLLTEKRTLTATES